MHGAQQLLDLLELGSRRPENLRRTGVVVDDCDRKDFEGHLLLDFPASLLITVRLDEFVDGVVVLVGILPPVRAQLADVADVVLLQTARQRAQLLINLH
jgi:hypothetical protein